MDRSSPTRLPLTGLRQPAIAFSVVRLDALRSPADLRDLNPEELVALADELRQRIVDTVGRTGVERRWQLWRSSCSEQLLSSCLFAPLLRAMRSALLAAAAVAPAGAALVDGERSCPAPAASARRCTMLRMCAHGP